MVDLDAESEEVDGGVGALIGCVLGLGTDQALQRQLRGLGLPYARMLPGERNQPGPSRIPFGWGVDLKFLLRKSRRSLTAQTFFATLRFFYNLIIYFFIC